MLSDPEFDSALRLIRDAISMEGNYGDAYPDEYARYALNHNMDPASVSEWAHLVTPMEDYRSE